MNPKRQRPGSANSRAAKTANTQGFNSHANSAQAQRERLLTALHVGPVSTIQARRDLDVLHPAMRILELRQHGHSILMHWSHEPTDCGRVHRVGRYVLMSGSDLHGPDSESSE